MTSIAAFRKMALGFEEAMELPHFEKTSFRIRKKIFATLDVTEKRVCVRLSPIDQSVFCRIGKDIFSPVPGAWGKQGYTYVSLGKVKQSMLKDALTLSYCASAPAKLAARYTSHTSED